MNIVEINCPKCDSKIKYVENEPPKNCICGVIFQHPDSVPLPSATIVRVEPVGTKVKIK